MMYLKVSVTRTVSLPKIYNFTPIADRKEPPTSPVWDPLVEWPENKLSIDKNIHWNLLHANHEG